MAKFGELEDCIVMKNWASGGSRGFGYVTSVSVEDAKDHISKAHRGIGFITFARTDSVDNLMADTHELGGPVVAVDGAKPKANEEEFRPAVRPNHGGCGNLDYDDSLHEWGYGDPGGRPSRADWRCRPY